MARFKDIVKDCGGSARTWKQDTFIGDMTFGSGGVCGPLAAKWIKDRYAGISFKNDTATKGGREEVMQLKRNQHAKPNTFVAEYLHDFGLSIRNQLDFADEFSVNQAMTLATSSAGYYFIGLTSKGVVGESMSGHAVALDMITYKLFDPNYGQAAFSNAEEVKAAFSTIYRLKYPDLRGTGLIQRYIPTPP